MTNDDLLTISGIAKQTGLDRRTVQRALLDVEPAAKEPSDRYRWLDVMHALTDKDVPRETVARLAPFGGSFHTPDRLECPPGLRAPATGGLRDGAGDAGQRLRCDG